MLRLPLWLFALLVILWLLSVLQSFLIGFICLAYPKYAPEVADYTCSH